MPEPQHKDWFVMDDKKRQKIIIDYIADNPGCSIETLVDSLEKHISRQKIFDLLYELEERELVEKRAHPKDRRKWALYVKKDSLLLIIPRQLNAFEESFFVLFDKAKVTLKNRYASANPDEKARLLNMMWNILKFYEMVHWEYSLLASSMWPRRIKDEKILAELYTTTFSKFAEMRLKIVAGVSGLDPELSEKILISNTGDFHKPRMRAHSLIMQFTDKKVFVPDDEFLWNLQRTANRIDEEYRVQLYPHREES